MKPIPKLPLTVLGILFSLLLIVLTMLNITKPQTKILYVDNTKVFENFSMTKELQRNGQTEFNNRKASLDSLYARLESDKTSGTQKQALMQQFIKEKEELNQFNDFYSSEQSSKIWARIKSYSAEFSNENKCSIIIGSDNKSNILFADQSIDVTNDLIKYINKKYEGLK